MGSRHWRTRLATISAVVVYATAPGTLSAGFVPAPPEWPRQYEAMVNSFGAVVAAAYRLELAHLRLERAQEEGSQCDSCRQQMEEARRERDRLAGALGEQLEHVAARREQVLGHLDQLAGTLQAGIWPGDEDLLHSLRGHRRLFERHNALGASFGQLVQLVEELQRRRVEEPKVWRLDPAAAEPLDRALRVLRAVAQQAFQQAAFCRRWIESMDGARLRTSDLASFLSSLEKNVFVRNLGKSADLLASAPEAFREQMRHSLENGVVVESSYEGSRGRIYRAVVEVVRQAGESIEVAEERAKILAARQLQQAVDSSIARLDHGRAGATVWKVTFLHGLEQRAEVLDDSRIRASAEIAEDDVFPLIPLPSLESLEAHFEM